MKESRRAGGCPAQPQAEVESDAQTEKGSETPVQLILEWQIQLRWPKKSWWRLWDELEEQAIRVILRIRKQLSIKEDAAEAVKEYIGKMYIRYSWVWELSLDNIIAELPEGAEDKAVVIVLKFKLIKKLSTEEKPH